MAASLPHLKTNVLYRMAVSWILCTSPKRANDEEKGILGNKMP